MLMQHNRRRPCSFFPAKAAASAVVLFLIMSPVSAEAADKPPAPEDVAHRIAKRLLANVVDEYGDQYHDVEAAIAAYRTGDADGARHMLTLAKDANPTLPPVDVMLAKLHISANQRDKAQIALDRAVQIAPHDPEPLLIAAELALASQRYVLAEVGYQSTQKLVDTFDENAVRRRNLVQRIHAGLASLHEHRGEYQRAIEHLDAWILLDADNPIPVGTLGRIHFNRGDLESARSAFEKLSQIDSDAPPLDIAMARLHLDADQFEQAKASLQEAVEKHGSDLRTRLTVAQLAMLAGEVELAKENVEEILAQNRNAVGARILQARIARIDGEQAEAEAILSDAVVGSPSAFMVSNELARTFASSEEEAKRKLGLQYAIKNVRDPNTRTANRRREAIMTLAWCLLQNGYSDKAEKSLQQLRDGGTISNENAFIAAKIYAARDNKKAAVSALQATLANRSAFPGRSEAKELLEKLTSDSRL